MTEVARGLLWPQAVCPHHHAERKPTRLFLPLDVALGFVVTGSQSHETASRGCQGPRHPPKCNRQFHRSGNFQDSQYAVYATEHERNRIEGRLARFIGESQFESHEFSPFSSIWIGFAQRRYCRLVDVRAAEVQRIALKTAICRPDVYIFRRTPLIAGGRVEGRKAGSARHKNEPARF